jgi:hypothetical protein
VEAMILKGAQGQRRAICARVQSRATALDGVQCAELAFSFAKNFNKKIKNGAFYHILILHTF